MKSRFASPFIVALLVGTVVVRFVADTSWWRAGIAVLVAGLMLRVGWMMIGGLARPVPDPLAPGELRKVKLTYRCSICGAEVRMTVAARDDPEPPRHCLEDMDVVTPVE